MLRKYEAENYLIYLSINKNAGIQLSIMSCSVPNLSISNVVTM